MAKSVWDELKDMFKTKSQRDEERDRQIESAREQQKGIIEQLGELDKQYKETLPAEEQPDLDALFPKESGYKELEYDLETDDEIENRVNRELEPAKRADQLKLQNQYGENVSAVEDKKQTAAQKLQQDFDDMRSAYDELAKNIRSNAVKNGTARGSIIQSALDEAQGAVADSNAEASKNFAAEINAMDKTIAELNKQKEIALEQLDLRYAADVNEQIDKLKKQRDAEQRKYDEYNNEIRQKEEKYQREREQDIADFMQQWNLNQAKLKKENADYENMFGYDGEKEENYLKRYNLAYDFYKSLSPEIAVAALESAPEMKYYLGYYYNRLLKTLQSNIDD